MGTRAAEVCAAGQPMPANAPWVGGLIQGRERISRTSARRRGGRRSKAEIDDDRRERLARTIKEIDELYAEYELQLPADFRIQRIGTAYARFSTRFQDSVSDQIRTLLDHALSIGVFVPRDLIFFDLAVRGFKKHRSGLDGVRRTLKSRRASVLLLFSTSRLFRKRYRTLEFVDQMHKGLGVRCIFVKSGVDTDDAHRWQSILAVQSMLDEFVVSMHIENIHAAHEGLLKKQLVFGTLSFGYKGDPISSDYTPSGRQRCRIVIDEESSAIVRLVFEWFVTEGLAIDAIVCRLNGDPEIPLSPRAVSDRWTRTAVVVMLKNTRYRGHWRYGVTEAVYMPDADYVAKRMRAEPLAAIDLPELRILSDEIWFAAQARLARNGSRGRHPKDGDRTTRPMLLNKLLFCVGHDEPQQLYVSGLNGNSMSCPICADLPAESRAIYSLLNRKLATKLICERVASLISNDPELPEAVFLACSREAEALQRPNPGQATQLERRIRQLGRSITATFVAVGETEEDATETRRLVAEFRAERARLQVELDQLAKATTESPKQPTLQEIQAMISNLAASLIDAAGSQDAAEVARAKNVIELLTGGQITLHQMGERKPRKGWLKASFHFASVPYLVQLALGVPAQTAHEPAEITVDILQPDDGKDERDRAWQMLQEGRLCKEIAIHLDCSRSKVSNLLRLAAEDRGEEWVDGRKRRALLSKKQVAPTLPETIADAVMERVNRGMYLKDIARELEKGVDMVTHAIRWWHEARKLPVPDGRSRRYELERRPAEPAADYAE
jgi:DNA invertase Pin-like site-specific DNA recombinase/transposase